MSTVVRTIGIAVTTSIADMLGRTVAHSVYLRGKSEHPARVVGTSSTPNDDDAVEINDAADKKTRLRMRFGRTSQHTKPPTSKHLIGSWRQPRVWRNHRPARYAPKDITNTRDIALELQRIDATPALTTLDKYRYKRQLMRVVFRAKQREIDHHLDSYENYLLARKDVEARSIALEAQKAIMQLEQDQLEMMKQIGLTHSNEVGNTLLQAGHMLTAKMREIESADLLPEITQQTLSNVRRVWEPTTPYGVNM